MPRFLEPIVEIKEEPQAMGDEGGADTKEQASGGYQLKDAALNRLAWFPEWRSSRTCGSEFSFCAMLIQIRDMRTGSSFFTLPEIRKRYPTLL